MRKTRSITLAAGVAAAAVALAGCSNPGGPGADQGSDGELSGEITFQTWALTPNFTDFLDGVIADFEEENPGVTVTLQDQPGDGYADKVLTQASTDTLPDVVNLPPDFALPLAQQGLLYDASQDGDLEDIYFEGSLGAFEFNGLEGTFGYPWYLNTDVNYWNTEQLERCGLDPAAPPTTLDELFEQAAVMAENCDDTYMISRVPGIGDFTLEGIDVLNDEGTEFVFNTPEAAALLDRYRDAYEGGQMPADVFSGEYLGNSQMFTEGKVAWTTGGATSLADFEKNNPSLKGKVAVTKALNTPPMYVQGVSVSENSAHREEAIAFARFITNAENQTEFAHLVNIFPSTLDSADDPLFSEDDGETNTKARLLAFEALQDAEVLQPYEVNGAMADIVKQQIELAVRGDITSQEALDTSVEQLNGLLERQ